MSACSLLLVSCPSSRLRPCLLQVIAVKHFLTPFMNSTTTQHAHWHAVVTICGRWPVYSNPVVVAVLTVAYDLATLSDVVVKLVEHLTRFKECSTTALAMLTWQSAAAVTTSTTTATPATTLLLAGSMKRDVTLLSFDWLCCLVVQLLVAGLLNGFWWPTSLWLLATSVRWLCLGKRRWVERWM